MNVVDERPLLSPHLVAALPQAQEACVAGGGRVPLRLVQGRLVRRVAPEQVRLAHVVVGGFGRCERPGLFVSKNKECQNVELIIH